MDNYAKVEHLLENYNMYKLSIENMRKEIRFLNEETGVKGIRFDSVGSANKKSDIVANTVLSVSEKKEYLEHCITRIQRKIDRLDRTMEGLSPIQRQILTQKYIEGFQWFVVAYNASCSESTAKRERRRAINKLAIGIFGKN